VLYTQERREKKKQQKRTRPPSSGEPQELVVVEKNMCHYKYLAVQESHWEEKEEGDPFVFHIRPFFYPPKNTKPPKEKETKQKEKAEDERKLEIIITEIVHFFFLWLLFVNIFVWK
jgi:hypothetical protein